jgi:hypothetical protein
MKPLRNSLNTTIRPRLLVVAARHAMGTYHRDAMLPKLMGLGANTPVAPCARVLDWLIAQEAAMEEDRRLHVAGWRAADHVMLMAALMTEARLLDTPVCAAVTTAAEV